MGHVASLCPQISPFCECFWVLHCTASLWLWTLCTLLINKGGSISFFLESMARNTLSPFNLKPNRTWCMFFMLPMCWPKKLWALCSALYGSWFCKIRHASYCMMKSCMAHTFTTLKYHKFKTHFHQTCSSCHPGTWEAGGRGLHWSQLGLHWEVCAWAPTWDYLKTILFPQPNMFSTPSLPSTLD